MNDNGGKTIQGGIITVNPSDCDVVVGVYKCEYATDSDNPMLVFVLDTDNPDSKQILWGFGKEEYHQFVRTLLNASELFEDADNEKTEA